MNRARVIPVLTVDNEKLVKTIKFKKPNYIGDPINAVKIFNEKEVDEIILLDISASKEGREPNFDKIEEICSEAFMPFAYGGGIYNINQIGKLFQLGIEKVVLNSAVEKNMDLLKEASNIYGSQSIVVSLDIKKNLLGKYQIMRISGSKKVSIDIKDFVKRVEDHGAGEIFINSIDRDGTYSNYDLKVIETVSKQTSLPVVACGGADSVNSFLDALNVGASAVGAGSLFVYTGEARGILINYPSQQTLLDKVYQFL